MRDIWIRKSWLRIGTGLLALALLLVPPLVALALDPRITSKWTAILRYLLPIAVLLIIAGVVAWMTAAESLSAKAGSIA